MLNKLKTSMNKEFEGDNKENFVGFYLLSKYKKLLDLLELPTPVRAKHSGKQFSIL
jgi:hypothetical protein